MGLDMYLNKQIYIGANYKHNEVVAEIKITKNGKEIKIDTSKITSITERAGYWRKANQIHNWFVTNIQNGKDNCQESYVEYEKLLQLKQLCEEVLETKDASKLPPTSGFFFGSTNVDDYYFQDLKDTIEIINSLDPDGEYYYQASW